MCALVTGVQTCALPICLSIIGHGDAPDFAKVRWIDDAQLRRAVAHDDVPAVLRHAPAFALVAKAAREREIIPTPAKAHAVLPCKTENFVLPRPDSLDRKSTRLNSSH